MVRNNGFWAELEGFGYFFYSPATDSVHKFDAHSEFDHVVYWQEERKQVIFQWLGRETLDTLINLGLPVTYRDSITDQEYSTWVDWQAEQEMDGIDDEITHLLE